jgi:hypothetical protein
MVAVVEHHAGHHRGLAHGVADIEAFDAGDAVLAQGLVEGGEAVGLVLAQALPGGQGQFRVLVGHLQPDAAFLLGVGDDLHLAPGLFRQPVGQALHLAFQDQGGGNGMADVVLARRRPPAGGQVRVLGVAGKEGAAAQAAAAAHHGEIDAGDAALHHRRDDVHILAGAALHELARAHLGQGLDLVRYSAASSKRRSAAAASMRAVSWASTSLSLPSRNRVAFSASRA